MTGRVGVVVVAGSVGMVAGVAVGVVAEVGTCAKLVVVCRFVLGVVVVCCCCCCCWGCVDCAMCGDGSHLALAPNCPGGLYIGVKSSPLYAVSGFEDVSCHCVDA